MEHKWSFTTFYNGIQTRSPRRFDTKDAALQAIIEKLAMAALDGEFPAVGLVAIVERNNVSNDPSN
jgi:hypothetical protein